MSSTVQFTIGYSIQFDIVLVNTYAPEKSKHVSRNVLVAVIPSFRHQTRVHISFGYAVVLAQ